jgi:hypothetical protein
MGMSFDEGSVGGHVVVSVEWLKGRKNGSSAAAVTHADIYFSGWVEWDGTIWI